MATAPSASSRDGGAPAAAVSKAHPAHALLVRLGSRGDNEAWSRYLPPRLRVPTPFPPPARSSAAWESESTVDTEDQLDTFGTIKVHGRVWTFSRQAHGCRWVQRALDNAADDEERIALAEELRGHVVEAAACPHANHVLQKCIVTVPQQALQFVVDEIAAASVSEVAKHKYGCRVVQRLVERCPKEQTRVIADAICADVVALSRHPYSTYVVSNLFEHGSLEDRLAITRAVRGGFVTLCAEPNSAAVVSASLDALGADEQRTLFELLLEKPGLICSMACTKAGAALVIRMLDALLEPQRRDALAILTGNAQASAASRHGREVLAHIERRGWGAGER